jgi:hypothetical protein
VKKWNLPTFPLADGMVVGKRAQDELEWLGSHGFYTSWSNHHVIIKLPNEKYRLYRNTQPIAQIEAEAATLYELIRDNSIPIAMYQWHDHRDEE